MDGALDSTVEF